ncbi:hypothetical protein QR77_05715 [Streptomyces sp. 150FB]|uniref:hypothetical protein n=1 Tax=Streptomyces sp. 150FB TaxID=1576605 RepID=UPI0005892DB1|nr:hypothetical protein [Streptomyces sp. 150FB]KIF73611.1 hypothetical protein QR77_05715 [Streptomyces sp. 150FB]
MARALAWDQQRGGRGSGDGESGQAADRDRTGGEAGGDGPADRGSGEVADPERGRETGGGRDVGRTGTQLAREPSQRGAVGARGEPWWRDRGVPLAQLWTPVSAAKESPVASVEPVRRSTKKGAATSSNQSPRLDSS